MALYTEQRKKQQNLITAFAIVLVITIGVLYLGFFRGERKGTGAGGRITIVKGILDSIKEIDLKTDVLENEVFFKLKKYEVLDKDSIKTGKDNPFIR